MANILGTESNFKSLSLKDLLQARDLYHYHLINRPNVLGTAVGLYFIRKGDPEPRDVERRLGLAKSRTLQPWEKPPRTLGNSEIRDYSWPCVHAFVRKWGQGKTAGRGGELHPEQMVPETLYMPDGRMVPVCVTQVEHAEPSFALPKLQWPGGLFGGGMPITVRTQERDRFATVGGLVSDGHTLYALTNKHVCGDSGEPVFTVSRGRMTKIGYGSEHRLTRLPFTEVYPEFTGRRTFVNLDVGLIELIDANEWTSRYVELGEVGSIADLNELNITVRLIDAPVVAVGAASGRIEGKIKALFYRFQSVGGYDYVSDFFIAPRALESESADDALKYPQTRPGDSGAIWHLITTESDDTSDDKRSEPRVVLRPLAIQWGGQAISDSASTSQFAFALATNLTTVCHALNVELVSAHNTGALPYWGQVGHYSIASFACEALKRGELKTFFKANVDQISFPISELSAQAIQARLKEAREGNQLIPLADVPDLLWKTHFSKVKGGRDTRWAGQGRSTGPEHPTHYADIDEPRSSDNKTLRDLCLQDDNNIAVPVWQSFYDAADHTEERSRGLLPFRIWQFFDSLVEFASANDTAKFLCAAGLLSHYVGDACQSLHGSMYADGYSDQKTTTTHRKRDTGEEYEQESHRGAGVHSTYETKMIDRYSTEIVEGVAALVESAGPAMAPIRVGKDAAKAAIHLMDRTAQRVPPQRIVEAYISAGEKSTVAVQDALWTEFGDQTIECMADGSRVLAAIWEAAWKEGSGGRGINGDVGRVEAKQLMDLYEDTDFIPSLNLDTIGATLR